MKAMATASQREEVWRAMETVMWIMRKTIHPKAMKAPAFAQYRVCWSAGPRTKCHRYTWASSA